MKSLWPHQKAGIESTLDRIDNGATSICITSPTGGGKSTIIEQLLRAFVERGLACAVFTNRRLLTNQLSKGLNEAGIHIGVRAADFEAWSDHTAPVQICSMQTELHRVLKKRERSIKRAVSEEVAHRDHQLFPASVVFIDEVHINCGDTMTAIVREYQEKHNAIIIGITATPLGVSHICDELLIAGNNTELRKCGALVPALCYEPASFDIWKVRRTKTGVYSQTELEDKVKSIWSQHVVGQVYTSWKQLNPDSKPSLGFAPGVKESLGLAVEFNQHGINAAHIASDGIYVDGKFSNTTEQADRDEVFARSKSGEIPIIFNRFVLREAIDLPWVEVLSLATPIASVVSYIQTVGRVLRASVSSGKTNATIIDHGGAVRMHGSPNMDRDIEWSAYFHDAEDKLTKDRLDKLRDPECQDPEPITCPECGLIRKGGVACPTCGHRHAESTRRIIQENGSLRLTKGDVFPKRRTKVKPDTARIWEQCYHRCKNAKRPMSFKQARALFFHEQHYWPPMDLPMCPKSKLDWSRKITAVHTQDLVGHQNS